MFIHINDPRIWILRMNCNDLWTGWKRDRYIDPVSGSNGVTEIQNVDIAYTKEKTLKKTGKRG